MRETWVQSLDWEDPLEEGITNHSSILAWRIPWTEDPGWLQSTEQLTHTHNTYITNMKRSSGNIK